MAMRFEHSDPVNLTVVLTLKDRSPFTYRWMRYMNDIACPYPILIADGGADQQIESHLRAPEHYPNLHYTYLRYPFDTDYATYYRKLADAVDAVTTPYVLLAENDDFFFLEHAGAFTRYLDGHAGVVSCGGQSIVLRLFSRANALVGLPSASRYQAVLDARAKSVTADRAADRLVHFITTPGQWSSWFHVHRTDALRAATSVVREHHFSDPVAHEIHVHLSLLAAGKSQQIDVPFWVRQCGTSQLSAALDATGNLYERFTRSNTLAELHRSVESLADWSDRDRRRIDDAIATWWAGHARAPRAARTAPRVLRILRRVLRLLKPGRPPEPLAENPGLRLPALEPYLLD